MQFSDFPTEEQQAWRETCHRFVDRQITREYIRRCDMDREYYYEGYEKVAREGWLDGAGGVWRHRRHRNGMGDLF